MSHPVPSGHRRRRSDLVLLLVVVALLASGVWMARRAMAKHPLDAPLPSQPTQTATPGQTPVGPDGSQTTRIDNYDNGADPFGLTDGSEPDHTLPDGDTTAVSVPTMARSSVFIPAIFAYAPAIGTDRFVPNPAHPGMRTIMLPSNPRRVTWYFHGAALAGARTGTTVIAGHVSYGGVWGAFHNLSSLVPGNLVWTRDANGVRQRWMVTQIVVIPQTEFPQDYWTTTGPRRLALVTCGGRWNAITHHFASNIIVTAVPR